MEACAILVSGGYDGQLKFWTADRASCYKSIPLPDSQVNALSPSPDYLSVAAAGNRSVRVFDAELSSSSSSSSHHPLLTLEGHSKNVSAVGYEHWGRWIYTGSEDGSVRIWDISSPTKNSQMYYQNKQAPVTDVALHPNQTTLFFVDQTGNVLSWDLRVNKILDRITAESGVPLNSVAVSGSGSTLAGTAHSGIVHLWCLESSCQIKGELKAIAAHDGDYVLKCRFCPQSQLLATTSADGTCCLWKQHAEGFSKEVTLIGHQRWVWDCCFSRDGSYLLTASSDCTCRLWDTYSGRQVLLYQGHSGPIIAAALLDFPYQRLPSPSLD